MAGARRVLVVDDDPNVASTLFLPHVLLDIRMPGIGGDTVLARLRTSTPLLPVIMVTGNRDEDEAKRVLAAGAWDYVSKPVDSAYLEHAIAAAAATSPESGDDAAAFS
jgi:CheY-like chemotaxis protein